MHRRLGTHLLAVLCGALTLLAPTTPASADPVDDAVARVQYYVDKYGYQVEEVVDSVYGECDLMCRLAQVCAVDDENLDRRVCVPLGDSELVSTIEHLIADGPDPL